MHYERETRGQNFFSLDRNLQDLLARLNPAATAAWTETLAEFGVFVGGPLDEEADYTDRHGPPELAPYDRDGNLTNHIVHNPLWQAASREAYARGVVGLNYGDRPAPYLITFAMGYLLAQSDVSLHCPVTMTGAVAYVLDRFAPAQIKRDYLHQLTRTDGLALSGGTWATELHGGSDVGATTTVATPEGDHHRLVGLKWFTSNANGGLALATARPPDAPAGSKGLGLYLVPTRLADGTANPMRLRRLKDKLGTRGIPTGEIDLTDTWAVEVAPPPQGFKLMMEALEFSRIHNAMAAIGLQRRAFLETLAYCSYREAFGATITSYPMVQDEILKVMAELEAGTALAFEAAAAFDRAHGADLDEEDNAERAWMRLATALAKYQTAEQANVATRAAIEIIGGNAYTYDYGTPRLLRDAQALTVWDGPANIQALEVLRLLGNRYPGYEAFETRIGAILAAAPAALDQLTGPLADAFEQCREAVALLRADRVAARRHARRLLDLMADTLAAALLVEEATIGQAAGDRRTALVARLFIEQRLAPPARRGIRADQDWTERHFAQLVGYEPVPVEQTEPASATA